MSFPNITFDDLGLQDRSRSQRAAVHHPEHLPTGGKPELDQGQPHLEIRLRRPQRDFAAALHPARARRLRLHHPGAVTCRTRFRTIFAERNLGSTGYYGNQWATYLYATDNWRLRNNLTLNLGLRWERTTVPTGQRLQALNSIADVPGLIDFHAPTTRRTRTSRRAIGIA